MAFAVMYVAINIHIFKGVDKRRTDKERTTDRGRRTTDRGRRTADRGRRTTDGGAFYIHMITTTTNYNTLN